MDQIDEFNILASIAELLGIELYRLERINRSDPLRHELLATMRSACHVYIRVQGAYLEFYTKEHGHSYLNPIRESDGTVWQRLDLANPKDLTRARLRATIKATERAYWDGQRQQHPQRFAPQQHG